MRNLTSDVNGDTIRMSSAKIPIPCSPLDHEANIRMSHSFTIAIRVVVWFHTFSSAFIESEASMSQKVFWTSYRSFSEYERSIKMTINARIRSRMTRASLFLSRVWFHVEIFGKYIFMRALYRFFSRCNRFAIFSFSILSCYEVIPPLSHNALSALPFSRS